jgi:heat shock protein HslJ
MKLATLAAALLLASFAAVCGEDQLPGADPFGTDTWRLVAATVDGAALVLADGSPVTLRVDNGQLGGTSACNSYGGPVTILDGVVTIGPDLVMTEMYCMDETVMTLEAAYLVALPRVDTVAVVGEELLLTGDGVELRFEVVPPEPDAALIGANWALDTITEGEVASTPAAPATLVFAADGSVSGSTGCNSLFGSYAPATGFSALGTTKMACEPPIMEQEALVLEILGPEATLTIEGSLLTIADLEGRTLVYRAAAEG